MKKYNRDKRGTYNARINKNKYTHDTCDGRNRPRIHIPIRYDTHNTTIYVPIIYGKTRDTRAQTYTSVTNVMREIFPEMDAHTDHVHRATAPYKKFIPQETNYTRPEPEPYTIHTDTRTVKCIIMDASDTMIYYGRIRRTRTVNVTRGTIDITLHRGTRTMTAYERATYLDRRIHGITIRDIKAHGVEIYYI